MHIERSAIPIQGYKSRGIDLYYMDIRIGVKYFVRGISRWYIRTYVRFAAALAVSRCHQRAYGLNMFLMSAQASLIKICR